MMLSDLNMIHRLGDGEAIRWIVAFWLQYWPMMVPVSSLPGAKQLDVGEKCIWSQVPTLMCKETVDTLERWSLSRERKRDIREREMHS